MKNNNKRAFTLAETAPVHEAMRLESDIEHAELKANGERWLWIAYEKKLE